MKTLTIISHTEHYMRADGTLVGLGSTVTEINHLLDVFDAIIHVAMLHPIEAPQNALAYHSEKITFVALPAVGGTSFTDKLSVLWVAPKVLKIIRKSIAQSSHFQFRAPTGIGVYVIPYLVLFCTKNGWFKYAGNWKQQQAPLAYAFQRWLLKQQSRTVTINGVWDRQERHCLSFENPCLTAPELQIGTDLKANKTLTYPINLCFVGRLEAAKGVDIIIDAIAGLDIDTLSKIKLVRMIGTGDRLLHYQERCKNLGLPIEFLGVLSRSGVHEIYKKSHAILLPSLSEGFPKVIAEAMNYGCVPIVSDVSSMSHYVKHATNGFLLKEINVAGLKAALELLLNLSEPEFKNLIQWDGNAIERFSYDFYNKRIKQELL